MGGFDEYRTRDEIAEACAGEATARAAIDEATINLGYVYHAMATHQPQDIVDRWIDKTYHTLRDRLSGELMMRAILLLVADDAREFADRLGSGVDDDDVAEVCEVWAEQGYGDG